MNFNFHTTLVDGLHSLFMGCFGTFEAPAKSPICKFVGVLFAECVIVAR
ncbi:MAG: hypothetical protein ACI87E_002804 [Mariniblastus sp.]|jgi:hypothetical protein